MRLIDLTLGSPEENLALDEALLDAVETQDADETLRFWESTSPFVVLGVSQVLAQNVNEQACRDFGIPVLRRCSAGGCVLQGPGCLNFSLVLKYECRPEIRSLRASYRHILNRICRALHEHGVHARHEDISDLSVNGRKVSGNAQKRRRRSVLHHGTLLYGMDCAYMDRCIIEPQDRPPYRGERTHGSFMGRVELSTVELREAVCQAFDILDQPQQPTPSELAGTRALVLEKYSQAHWIRRR